MLEWKTVAGSAPGLYGAEDSFNGLCVSGELGSRAIAEDAIADLRHASTLSVVADTRELRRRPDPRRFRAGLHQHIDRFHKRSGAIALRRRSGGLRVRTLSLHRPDISVFRIAGDAHAAADRGAGADVCAVQQAR